MKQKVKRQLTKQQKSAVRRRLQVRAKYIQQATMENMQNIKPKFLEAASFWGE